MPCSFAKFPGKQYLRQDSYVPYLFHNVMIINSLNEYTIDCKWSVEQLVTPNDRSILI